MKEEKFNGLQEILTQNLNEMKEEAGESFSLEKVNLAELERRTGISRARLRRLKENGFVVKPHGLRGRTSNNNVIHSFSGVIDGLLKKGISNASVCYDRIVCEGYTGSKSAVKTTSGTIRISSLPRGMQYRHRDRGRRYTTALGNPTRWTGDS